MKIREKKLYIYMRIFTKTLWIFTVGLLASCGSPLSAPPVSLPAPVIGRITVTAPDDSGQALVIGGVDAVSAASFVLINNDTRVGSASESDLNTCSRQFSICVTAESDGSFQAEIPASEADDISVQIIDRSSGRRRSEISRQPVPRNIRRFTRPVSGVVVIPEDDLLVVLQRNAEASDTTNGAVMLVDLENQTRQNLSYDGVGPARIVYGESQRQLAVLDDAEDFIGLVDQDSMNFNSFTQVSLASPTDLVYSPDNDLLYATSSGSSSLVRIRTTDATITGSLGPSSFGTALINNVVALDVADISGSGGIHQDIIVLAGIKTQSGVDTPYLSMLIGSSLTFLVSPLTLPTGTVPADIIIFPDEDRIFITDRGENRIFVYEYDLENDFSEASISLANTITATALISPLDIYIVPTEDTAFITANNRTDDRPDTVLTLDLNRESITNVLPIGLLPTGMAFDDDRDVLYISGFTSRSVAAWDLDDLIP